MNQIYQQYWNVNEMEVKENIMKMNISRKQYKRLLKNINDKSFSFSSIFSAFTLNKKQFIRLANKINDDDTLFALISSQYKFKKDKDTLNCIITNFYRIEKPVFDEEIPALISTKLEMLSNQISYLYGYSMEEDDIDSVFQVIKKVLPFNIANSFISIFLERYCRDTLKKEFVKKYINYFPPKFLATFYQENIDDPIMTQELMNAIKENISDFVKFSFGAYSEHFVKINIGIDMDQMMLRNTIGDDEQKTEPIDSTPMINFHIMKQGEKE